MTAAGSVRKPKATILTAIRLDVSRMAMKSPLRTSRRGDSRIGARTAASVRGTVVRV